MTETRLALDAAFDRALFWEAGGSVRHLVAHLRAEEPERPPAAARPPVNLALVLDASGSMAGRRLEAAKAAALDLAGRLGPDDRLSVISFASDVAVHGDGLSMTPENQVRLAAAISRLGTRGNTCLSGGWFAAVDCAARIAEDDPALAPRVLLLSDGHANAGIIAPADLRFHAQELHRRGVVTSCVGIGDGYDEVLLRGIAEGGGGRLHDAELCEDIGSVLAGELEDIAETVVEGAELHLSVPDGASVEILGRDLPRRRSGAHGLVLGAIAAGTQRTVVFRIRCPAADPGTTLPFALTARGRCAATGTVLPEVRLDAVLTAAKAADNDAQRRDPTAAVAVARHWFHDLVTRADHLNRNGNFVAAEHHLCDQLRHFARYVRDLPECRDLLRRLEMLAHRVRRPFSPRLHKELVLGSVLALEDRPDRRAAPRGDLFDRLDRGDL